MYSYGLLSTSGSQQSCRSAGSNLTSGFTAGVQRIMGMSIGPFSHGHIFSVV